MSKLSSKIFALLLVLMLVVSVFSAVFVSAVEPQTEILLQQDFEGYEANTSNDALGSAASPASIPGGKQWCEVRTGMAGNAKVNITSKNSNKYAGFTVNALSSGVGYPELHYKLNKPKKGKIQVSFDVRACKGQRMGIKLMYSKEDGSDELPGLANNVPNANYFGIITHDSATGGGSLYNYSQTEAGLSNATMTDLASGLEIFHWDISVDMTNCTYSLTVSLQDFFQTIPK